MYVFITSISYFLYIFLIINSKSDKTLCYLFVNSEFWGGLSRPPLRYKNASSSSTLWKVCSHSDQAQQHHGYSRNLWSHLKPPSDVFFSFSNSPPLSPSSPFSSHLLVKERVVLTSAINDHDTLTSSTASTTSTTHTCSQGNVNLQLISFLTHIAQKHTLLGVACYSQNIVCVAWGQFRPFKERFTKVYLVFESYINYPHAAFLHSERRDLYGCWTD